VARQVLIVGLLISYYPSYQSYTYKITDDVNKTKFLRPKPRPK